MPTADELKAKLTASTIAPTHVEITDTSNCGCGSKFEAIIVAESFDGMGPLDRQRAVNEVIADREEQIRRVLGLVATTMIFVLWGTPEVASSLGLG